MAPNFGRVRGYVRRVNRKGQAGWLLVVAVLGTVVVPPATADPSAAPDLSGYTPANLKDYDTYYNYPTTNGIQFATPGGYRCLISYTGRANPPVKQAYCWGRLPGTSANFAGVRAAMNIDPAKFATVDLAAMETYRDWRHPADPQPISPNSYRQLPVGSKLTYPESGTCAVTDKMTACVLGEHGFVLDPQGSRTF